jgi:Xaa-Pro aminopeptidase
MNHALRQSRLKERIRQQALDALLVTHLPNIRYLCGFTGSSGVLAVTPGRVALFTDGRYVEQAGQEVQGAATVITRASALQAAGRWLARRKARSIAVEADHLTIQGQGVLRAALPAKSRLRPLPGIVERLRMIKDPQEVERLRAAARLGSNLFQGLLPRIRPGRLEVEVAAELEFAARRRGGEGMSFDTIVASGARSALPHGRASSQPIPNAGFLILDFGVILAGYCSDMTRALYLGRAPREARRMYEAVRHAQAEAVATVRPGTPVGEVDRAARRVLAKAGLAGYFTHSTGHGVGLEIHEPPRLAKGEKELLVPGMVVTIEPGVYVPRRGGVRIEDMVLVTEQGCEVLTPAPRELIEL